jgi:hypothetical protein
MSRNLKAFNDVMGGGFEIYEFGEEVNKVWAHSSKSKKEIKIYPVLVKIILDHSHIHFEEK